MKQFISVNDVPDINRLAAKALQYKQQPLADKLLGSGKKAMSNIYLLKKIF